MSTAGAKEALLLLLLVSLSASDPIHAARIRECGPQHSFYVVSHGWHTGLVIPHADLAQFLDDSIPNGEQLEVGWGDEQFYQAGEGSVGLALQALAWSTPAVLHVVAFAGSPERNFPGSEVVELTVPAAGYSELLGVVADSFTRTKTGGLIRLGRGLYGNSAFFRARGRFHVFNTCNTWVARAIEASGYPISVHSSVSAGSLLSQLSDSTAGAKPCYAVHWRARPG